MKTQGGLFDFSIEEIMAIFTENRRERNLIKSDLYKMNTEFKESIRSMEADINFIRRKVEKLEKAHERGSEHCL